MIFSAACWLVVIWFMDPEYEARHPGLFRRCAWVAIVLCCVFACTHYVYRFTTSFQLLFGALPSRGSTRQRPQLRLATCARLAREALQGRPGRGANSGHQARGAEPRGSAGTEWRGV